jgi:hypothetical protein
MVSLPVVPDDPAASAVMPPGVFYQLVTWTGTSYAVSAVFEAGRGYWLLVLQDVDVTVSGQPVDSLSLGLSAGWNMVGGPIDEVEAVDVFSGFHQLVTWNGYGYQTSSSFEPGKGYWVLVLSETNIHLPPT